MNQEIQKVTEYVRKFTSDSKQFLQVCEKPDVTGTPFHLTKNSRK
jgi:preprotein translocase subunit Sss1